MKSFSFAFIILAWLCFFDQGRALLHHSFVHKVSVNKCCTQLKDATRSEAFQNMTFIERTGFGTKRTLHWDENTKSLSTNKKPSVNLSLKPSGKIPAYLIKTLKYTFLPGGNLTHDYFIYSSWRILQRFLSATTSVFGTQSLLLALGVKQSKIGITAATSWVLKDALGKFSRIFWASKNGKLFDSDAKRWRFRSALLFAIGIIHSFSFMRFHTIMINTTIV